MPKPNGSINEKTLTKGELRKLTALRKSLGNEIAEDAFTKWLSQKETGEAADPNIELIEKAIAPLIGDVRIPRGTAYAIRRGRGRFIVEAVDMKG